MPAKSAGARRRALALSRQPQLPREGTQTRTVYDLLYEHRGRPVPEPDWVALVGLVPNLEVVLTYLVDRYGLEISGRCLVSAPGPRLMYA